MDINSNRPRLSSNRISKRTISKRPGPGLGLPQQTLAHQNDVLNSSYRLLRSATPGSVPSVQQPRPAFLELYPAVPGSFQRPTLLRMPMPRPKPGDDATSRLHAALAENDMYAVHAALAEGASVVMPASVSYGHDAFFAAERNGLPNAATLFTDLALLDCPPESLQALGTAIGQTRAVASRLRIAEVAGMAGNTLHCERLLVQAQAAAREIGLDISQDVHEVRKKVASVLVLTEIATDF